jgi:hypothetical protein
MILGGGAEKDEYLINGAPQKHNTLQCIERQKEAVERSLGAGKL